MDAAASFRGLASLLHARDPPRCYDRNELLLRVLVAVDSATVRRRILRLLKDQKVTLVPAGRQPVLERVRRCDVDLLLVSRGRLGEHPEDLLRALAEVPERPEVIALADRDDPADQAELLAAGCLAVLYSRLPDETLADALRALLERRNATTTTRLRVGHLEDLPRLDDFVSKSPSIQAFMQMARRVARTDSTVLILGETGVGKERLARGIHAEGARREGPFVAVNCGALAESLLESELFGHEEGSFTGATRSRRGYFELAHGGTLFLDEIGDMPLHLQVKLLRVLQDRQILRLGGERHVPVDLRLIAATNSDLEDEVRAKRFRSDLFYRLAVVTLTIPPLRERREDIPELVSTYMAYLRPILAHHVDTIRPEALEALVAYSWPGNVRELINVIERALLISNGRALEIADLPPAIASAARSPGLGDAEAGVLPSEWMDKPLKELRRQVQESTDRLYLTQLLRETGGRIGRAAERAGIDERSLYELMRRYGLRKEAFRYRSPRRAS